MMYDDDNGDDDGADDGNHRRTIVRSHGLDQSRAQQFDHRRRIRALKVAMEHNDWQVDPSPTEDAL